MDLVGDHKHLMRQADPGDLLQLLPVPHPAHRIVGVAEHQYLGVLPPAELFQYIIINGVTVVFQLEWAGEQTAPGGLHRGEKGRVGGGHDDNAVAGSGIGLNHLPQGGDHVVRVHQPLPGDF